MTSTPRALGRYVLKRRLAAGGMGEVYLGEVQGAANFTKRVAIKRILPHLAQTPGFEAKFIDEAHVMVQLHHGNIVPVLELGDEAGELFIVMEYLPGRDLRATLQRLRSAGRPCSVELAIWLLCEVCDALDYAHRKTGADGQPLQIVHRDVSPSNVMLGASGEVKLLDFGIARARGSLHQSISGTLQGKFAYMSPEQAEGLAVDARSDIFSAGLVLYELLTGVRPLEAESETETLRRVRSAEIPPPSTHRPEISPDLDAALMRALTLRPSDRWTTAADFGRALSQAAAPYGASDPRGLTRLLEELFPEGVVPEAPLPELSLDAALNAQLEAAQAANDGMAQTRTASRPQPAATPSASPSARPAVEPSTPPAEVTPHQAQLPSGAFSASPTRVPKFRWIFLGAAVASIAAAVLLLTPPAQVPLDVRVTPADAAGLRVTVNGAPHPEGATYAVGTRVDVCAAARDFQERCEGEYRVRAEANVVRLGLEPRIALVTFTATPANTEVVVEGIEAPFTQGTPRNVRLGHAVRVVYRAAGHEPLEKTYDLLALGEPRAVREALTPQVVPPDAPPAVDSASAPPTNEAVGRRTSAAMSFVVDSSPTGAEVYRGATPIGRTPLTLPAPSSPTTLTFRLSGFADLRREVGPADGPRLAVALVPAAPGFVTVRVMPPAGSLLLNGADLGTNVLDKRALPPGEHEITARFKGAQETRKVVVKAGESVVLKPFILVAADEADPAAPQGASP
jgi:serine/threonine protein kinase